MADAADSPAWDDATLKALLERAIQLSRASCTMKDATVARRNREAAAALFVAADRAEELGDSHVGRHLRGQARHRYAEAWGAERFGHRHVILVRTNRTRRSKRECRSFRLHVVVQFATEGEDEYVDVRVGDDGVVREVSRKTLSQLRPRDAVVPWTDMRRELLGPPPRRTRTGKETR